MAVGQRLSAALCEHVCMWLPCFNKCSHSLWCSLGFVRQARHSNINDLIYRVLNKNGILTIKELSGLCMGKDWTAKLWFPGATGVPSYGRRPWWTQWPLHLSTRPRPREPSRENTKRIKNSREDTPSYLSLGKPWVPSTRKVWSSSLKSVTGCRRRPEVIFPSGLN